MTSKSCINYSLSSLLRFTDGVLKWQQVQLFGICKSIVKVYASNFSSLIKGGFVKSWDFHSDRLRLLYKFSEIFYYIFKGNNFKDGKHSILESRE